MVDTIDLTIIWHITVLTTLLCTQHYIFLRLEHQMQQQQQKAQMSTTTTRRVTAMMIMIPRASTEEGGKGGREGGKRGWKGKEKGEESKEERERRGEGREVVMSSLLCPTIKWFWHEHSKKEPETIVCQQLHGNTECSKFGNEKTVQMREASCAGNSFYG